MVWRDGIMLMMGRWDRCHRERGYCPKDSQQALHHNGRITVVRLTCRLVLMLWLFRLQVSVEIGIFIILDAIFHKLYHVL